MELMFFLVGLLVGGLKALIVGLCAGLGLKWSGLKLGK
jgi:hypothetical protein